MSNSREEPAESAQVAEDESRGLFVMSICKALILIVLSLALARVSRADVHQLLPETLQSEGHQRYLTTESRQAAAFAKSWGITSGRSFLSLAGRPCRVHKDLHHQKTWLLLIPFNHLSNYLACY